MSVLDEILEECLITLHNVSFDLDDKSKRYEPRVPYSTGSSEDAVTPRICLADNIANCIQAIACANREVFVGSKFIHRSAKIPLNHKALVRPSVLFEKNLVPDATENNEYWFLEPLDFKVSLCEIVDFKSEHVIAWEPLDFKDVKRIIEKHLPEFKYSMSSLHPYDIYQEVMTFINNHVNEAEPNSEEWLKWCRLEDAIYDDVIELPWAQKTRIYDLEIRVLEEL